MLMCVRRPLPRRASVPRSRLAGARSQRVSGRVRPLYGQALAGPILIAFAFWGMTLSAGITRQFWSNLPGSSLADLEEAAAFPLHPDRVDQLDSLAVPKDQGDRYGERLAGYLVPATSGNYTFWIASDDASVLRLSTDASPEHLAAIARVSGYTAPEAWDASPEQKSRPVRLEAGRAYFLEVLHKEGGGADHLSVAWSGPGIPRRIVPGAVLRPLTGTERYPLRIPPIRLRGTPGATIAQDILSGAKTWNPGGKLRIIAVPQKSPTGIAVNRLADRRTLRLRIPQNAIGLDRFTCRVSDGIVPAVRVPVVVAITPPLDAGAFHTTLLRGVRRIEGPAPHGGVAVLGPGALGLLRAPDGRTLAAAAAWGRGRVVLFGAAADLDFARVGSKADNARLYANIVRWCAGKSRPPRNIVVLTPSKSDAAWLRTHGFPRAAAAPQWRPRLKHADVLVLALRTPQLSSAEVTALSEFAAKQGRGLILAGNGWQWAWNRALKHVAANRLARQAGLAWSDGASRKLPALTLPGAACDQFANAARVIARLQSGGISAKNARSEAAQALQALERAFPRAEPAREQARKILLAHARGITPSPRRPVRDPLDRAALDAEAEMLLKTPVNRITAHRTAFIYGVVPKDAPRVTSTISYDITRPALGTYGQPMGDRWLSTGLYAAPGERIVVTVPPRLANHGLQVRINGDWNDLRHTRDVYLRMPFGVSRLFPIRTASTPAANPYGGLIYIDLPWQYTPGAFQVRISGAVEAPTFILGKDTNRDWLERLSKRPAPWGEIITPNLIISTFSSQLRPVKDMEALARWWNSGVLAEDELVGSIGLRTRPERMVNMIETAWGSAYASYPIGAWNWEFGDLEKLKAGNCWGQWHEMGHLHQRPWWTFRNCVEVTVNIPNMYAIEHICTPPRAAGGWARMWDAAARANMVRKMRRDGGFNQTDVGTRLCMYRELREAFGWGPYKKVFREYLEAPQSALPKTQAEERDQWLFRFSRAVGRDLTPFFTAWKLGTTAAGRRRVAALHLPKWTMVEAVDDTLFYEGNAPLTFQGRQLTTNDLAVDNSPIRFSGLAGKPEHGALKVAGNNRWTYTPDGSHRRDHLAYTVQSVYGDRFRARVTFRWRPKGGFYSQWLLNTIRNGNVSDVLGRAPGKIVGTGVLRPAGPGGPALYFNGADTAVVLPALDLDVDTLTLTAWVQRDGPQPGWSAIFFCRGGHTAAGLNFGRSDELRYHWNGSDWFWNSKLIVPDRRWVFVALVIQPRRATVWLNDRSAVHHAAHGIEEFDAPACIGAEAPGRRSFKGWIRDVRLYVKALDAGELAALRAAGPAK